MTIFEAGAAGFFGSNFGLDWLEQSNEPVVNLDLLNYAGNLELFIKRVLIAFFA